MSATSAPLAVRVRAARAVARRLTIYRIPLNLSTIVAVTARALESFPGVTIDEIDDPYTIGAALDAVLASLPEPVTRSIDARYGLVFRDAHDERVLSVYKGYFASRGQIDDTPVDYEEPALDDWLRERYPPPAPSEDERA
jgi:hypothetical protein